MKTSLQKKEKRGMTLIELAIVLGVVGLVLGAIWVAGSAVRQKQMSQESLDTITEIATRVRSLYRAYPTIEESKIASTITKQIEVGLFPDNVVVDNDEVRNVWGGDINIGFKRTNNVIIGFTVAMEVSSSLSVSTRNAICMDMLSRLPASGHSDAGFAGSAVPLPSADKIPVKDLSSGEGPIYAYVSRSLGKGGGWHNVSGEGVTDMVTNTPCSGVAFFFKL